MSDYSKKPIPEIDALEIEKHQGYGKYINPKSYNKEGRRVPKEETVPLTRMVKPIEAEASDTRSLMSTLNESDVTEEIRRKYSAMLFKKMKENSIHSDRPLYKTKPEKLGIDIAPLPSPFLSIQRGMRYDPSSGKIKIEDGPGNEPASYNEFIEAVDAMGVTGTRKDGVESFQAGTVHPEKRKKYMEKLLKKIQDVSPRT